MSEVSIDVAAVTAEHPEAGETPPPADRPADRAAGRSARWWRAWRDRFGLAEVCGTLAAVAGFAAGYAQAGSLLAAGAWHAIHEQLASCAVAETVDGFLIRPAGGCWCRAR